MDAGEDINPIRIDSVVQAIWEPAHYLPSSVAIGDLASEWVAYDCVKRSSNRSLKFASEPWRLLLIIGKRFKKLSLRLPTKLYIPFRWLVFRLALIASHRT